MYTLIGCNTHTLLYLKVSLPIHFCNLYNFAAILFLHKILQTKFVAVCLKLICRTNDHEGCNIIFNSKNMNPSSTTTEHLLTIPKVEPSQRLNYEFLFTFDFDPDSCLTCSDTNALLLNSF